MGMRSSSLTAGLAYNLHAPDFFNKRVVSLHIVIPSVGRETIFRLLASLEEQLKEQVRRRRMHASPSSHWAPPRLGDMFL